VEHGHVEALDDGEVADVLVDEVGEPLQQRAPFGGRHGGPGGERVARGGDGGVRRTGVTARDVGEHA
jgi:hypothetical protein